jgi:hypothetical protein
LFSRHLVDSRKKSRGQILAGRTAKPPGAEQTRGESGMLEAAIPRLGNDDCAPAVKSLVRPSLGTPISIFGTRTMNIQSKHAHYGTQAEWSSRWMNVLQDARELWKVSMTVAITRINPFCKRDSIEMSIQKNQPFSMRSEE